MSYLIDHPWDKYGQPPRPGFQYDEKVEQAVIVVESVNGELHLGIGKDTPDAIDNLIEREWTGQRTFDF